ncbi:replicative DNA helicase [Pseudohoeflea coraliihabitans]|uniref:AAA family ATPase n=1 Tax=Pseudohoeflea coraliihabitans TaxID=2860393 RepID=A0ABS6WM20_9HYPH|nr:DnaB-like helicase C-terminal domain-containing protein [Pseudohoeflea sp. DP4N28-3]MBW3096830.1 AAA family ATPase [Pseudohoeflea sp. DP4N28-3]
MNVVPIPQRSSNLDAEQALLGAIMLNNEAYDIAIKAGLREDDFTEMAHAEIFRAAGRLIEGERVVNPVTLKTALPDVDIAPNLSISQYLARLAVEAVSIVNVPDYADAIIKEWVRNEFSQCSQLYAQAAQMRDDLELADQIEEIDARLQAARARLAGEDADGKSFAKVAPSSLDATLKAKSGEKAFGIDYHIPPLKQLIGPLMGGTAIVVGGLTKHGKSALAQQISRGAADEGHPVFYYSGEMSAEELAMREKARDTGISVKRQSEGALTDTEAETLFHASQKVGKLPITVQDRRCTVDQLIAQVRALKKASRGVMPVVVVDSMLLLDRNRFERRMNEYEFADYVMDKFKATARSLNLPVIVLAQLKKNTIEKDRRYAIKRDVAYFKQAISRRPRASDLYGSVEKHADHVVIVFNPEVVLKDMEPAEGTDEYVFWEDVLSSVKDRAEILLSLSRSAQWPARRTVHWSGVRHHFAFQSDVQRNLF